MQSKRSTKKTRTTFSNISKQYWKSDDFVVKLSTKKRLAPKIEENSLSSLLSSRELLVYKKLKASGRKQEWAYGRVILKDLIASHLLPEKAVFNGIEVVANSKHKPNILVNGKRLNLDHSLSHSSDIFFAALSKKSNVLIGVDVEAIKNITLSVKSYFLNKKEVERLEELEQGESRALLFQYWTIKEATLKALGIGLQGNMKGIFVENIENHQSSITISKQNLYASNVKGQININSYSSIINKYAIAITTITTHTYDGSNRNTTH